MPKINQPNVILNKVHINQPFKTMYLFWEKDLYFKENETENDIIIRTHDKVIQNSRIYYKNQSILAQPGEYIIKQKTGNVVFRVVKEGWVSEIINENKKLDNYEQTKLSPFKEEDLEWEGKNPNLIPIYVERSRGDYRMGINYNSLELRNT